MTGQRAADHAVFGRTEYARFWRVPRFDDLECLAARFETYRFALHTHDTYGLAVILDGAQRFRWRGASHVAPAGSLAVMNPGEPHDGRPAGASFAYRTLYPPLSLIRRIAAEVFDGLDAEPAFAKSVIDDRDLAVRVAAMHRALQRSPAALEKDSAVVGTIGLLLRRHATLARPVPATGRAARLVDRLRDYIDANLTHDISLDDLAREAQLSRFHVLRVFRRTAGMTPHAYLLSRRVARARLRLAAGRTLTETALACGFFDQSHFTRVFKRHTGLTPGRYRRGSNSAQDGAA